jgi:5-formyltetrahydrofolate cyclo-ligase
MRAQLSAQELQVASERLSEQLSQQREFVNAKRIAAYVGSKGEIDPMPLLHLAHFMGKQCYLPVLHPFLEGRLWFAPWSPQHDMRFNHFNIPEPVFSAPACRRPQFLDLILVPLLGFDAQCHRLGMGGGYYDRTLAFRRRRRTWQGPALFGLAHECQRVPAIATQPWDIQLDRIFTGDTIYPYQK